MNPTNALVLALYLSSIFSFGHKKKDAAQTPPAATATTPATPVATAATEADGYVIGASDVLTITVWKEPTLSGTLLVRPDGMISLSLLGDVQASGLTPLQLSDQIASKLKKFIQDPNVSVVITQIHSKVVYLLGEVVKRGPVEMAPGMTLLEAISSGGGLTDFANTKKIYILRGEGGLQLKIPVNYKGALKGDATLNVILKPGDTIVVP
jgi:polysaccharide export outer membrane protein